MLSVRFIIQPYYRKSDPILSLLFKTYRRKDTEELKRIWFSHSQIPNLDRTLMESGLLYSLLYWPWPSFFPLAIMDGWYWLEVIALDLFKNNFFSLLL